MTFTIALQFFCRVYLSAFSTPLAFTEKSITMSGQLININAAFEISGITLCLCGLLFISLGKFLEKTTKKYLSLFCVFHAADLICVLLPDLFTKDHTVIYISSFGHFLFSPIIAFISLCYLLDIVDPKKDKKTIRRIVIWLLILHFALFTFYIAANELYMIDGHNRIQKGKYYYLFLTQAIIPVIIGLIYDLKEGGKLSKKEQTAFAAYGIVPITAIVIQTFVFPKTLLIPHAVSLTMVILFTVIITEETNSYMQSSEQLSQMRIKLLLSRIKPHFLCNSLTSIIYIIDKDPDCAKKALIKLAQYLRNKFELLGNTDRVKFSDELEYIDVYLSLEKLRFGDKLNVTFDIKDSDFSIPVLSIQPLVENAVVHGIQPLQNRKGEINISSEEADSFHRITIKDNGVGFDTSIITCNNLTNSQIGILSVKNRLISECGGSLTITGIPSVGTECVVLIPKEDSNENTCN